LGEDEGLGAAPLAQLVDKALSSRPTERDRTVEFVFLAPPVVGKRAIELRREFAVRKALADLIEVSGEMALEAFGVH